MKRLLTAAIGAPLVLAAIFLFRGWWFFALMTAVIEVAVWEYVEILRPQAPRAPLRILLLLVPAAAFALSYAASLPVSADALRLYLEGSSYEQMAEELGCDTKTIDNALQRVKRKILTHQQGRQVLQ